MGIKVLIRGGGDLASGVAARLHWAGFSILITELAQPRVVRRTVSFAEAVIAGRCQVEGIAAQKVSTLAEIDSVQKLGYIAVMVSEDLSILEHYRPEILVDARLLKSFVPYQLDEALLLIGLGPGFEAGRNCHAVIETMRGHTLGRVITQGSAMPDTGIPESVMGQGHERVLRAPAAGITHNFVEIGSLVKAKDPICDISGMIVSAPFKGVLRGLIMEGSQVKEGDKIGDIDPRTDVNSIHLISDKALAVGGGVLEAILRAPYFSVCGHLERS